MLTLRQTCASWRSWVTLPPRRLVSSVPARPRVRISIIKTGQNAGKKRKARFHPPKTETPARLRGSKRLGTAHGQQIHVYHHYLTHQIIYSLDARLKNARALKQLPFNGKKSQPAALRKDLWHRLATMTLPEGHGSTGRSVFNKLRELKTLHEHSWDPAIMKRDAPVKLDDEVEEKFARMERERAGNVAKSRSKFKAKLWMKHKRKVLNNQKPNAIADMALICAKLKEGKNHIGLVGAGTNTPVEIHWTNIDDAHYAAHWSDNVIHDTLRVEANNRDSTKPRPFHATMAAYVAEKQRLAGKATVSA